MVAVESDRPVLGIEPRASHVGGSKLSAAEPYS